MLNMKKELKKKYKYMSDKEFNLIWSFIMEDDLVRLFVENQFEQKYRNFR